MSQQTEVVWKQVTSLVYFSPAPVHLEVARGVCFFLFSFVNMGTGLTSSRGFVEEGLTFSRWNVRGVNNAVKRGKALKALA